MTEEHADYAVGIDAVILEGGRRAATAKIVASAARENPSPLRGRSRRRANAWEPRRATTRLWSRTALGAASTMGTDPAGIANPIVSWRM